jgi:hypothetical protein
LSFHLLPKNINSKTQRTTILPFVLLGFGNWSLASREGHRLKEFHNRVLRKIFGAKREQAIGEGRKLQL